jgi:YHS domain-containing protein
MGSKVSVAAETFDYKGVRYYSCCAGCSAKFAEDPEKFVKLAASKDEPTGESLHDPISRMRIKPRAGLPREVYHGVLYTFENLDDKKKFDAGADAFARAPDAEVLRCPILPTDIKELGAAPSYFDAEGMRIYLCCYGCINPAKFHRDESIKNSKVLAVKAAVHIVTEADLKAEAEEYSFMKP